MNPTPDYRPDIDGLRAISVLGVIFYHLDPNLLGGGYVGVDVFFVISGFLITTHIIRDLKDGRFSLARFYEKRIRRILPALLFMIAASWVMAWFILLPEDMAGFVISAKYAAISLPNLYFLKEIQDYFSPSVSHLPLLHTWSLGVEEQFYILFPLLLMVLFRRFASPRIPLVVAGSLFALSLLAACMAMRSRPDEAFFLLQYRAWELLLGALLGISKLRLPRGLAIHCTGIVGLSMILVPMMVYTGDTPFPGLAAVPPCAGDRKSVV